jgi:hypothetical protein
MIASYPCPHPSRSGACGCPTSSARCYGAIRAVREEFNRNFEQGGLMDAVHVTLANCEPKWGWTSGELMDRFLTVTRVS